MSLRFLQILATVILNYFLLSPFALAATYHVGPTAALRGDGSDWANRMAWSSINSFERGSTYYLMDGSYAGKTFSTPEDGLKVITIKKAIESDHGLASGWDRLTMGSGQATWTSGNTFTSGYWTLDGQTGAGFSVSPPDTTGTNYGFNMSLYKANTLTTGSYNPIRNLEFRHIFASTGTTNNGAAMGWFVSNESSGLRVSNLVISHCLLIGYNQALRENSANWDNVTWQYNNYLYMQSSTGINGDNGGHGNPINVIWSVTTNMTVRHSLFYKVWSSNAAERAGLSDCISGNGGTFDGLKVYGCVFDGAQSGDPVIGAFKGSTGGPDHGYVRNCRIYNNTFLNTDAGYSSGRSSNGVFGSLDGGSGNIVQNNLLYNTIANMNYCSHDYNTFVRSVTDWVANEPNGRYADSVDSVGNAYAPSSFDIFKNWQGMDYSLKANTDRGNSLDTEFAVDPLGHPRSTWTRGAFEYQIGTGAPSAPSNLRISP